MMEDCTVSFSASVSSTASPTSTASSFMSSPASSSSSSSSSTSSSSGGNCCRYVHLDKDWCPGTKKLREIARKVAYENDCQHFSKKISKQILNRMEGMRFFRSIRRKSRRSDSSDSDSSDDGSCSDTSGENDNEEEYGFGCYTKGDEEALGDEELIRPSRIRDAIRPFYDGERFMIKTEVDCHDVYFNHPNHPGTQAFVRASQQLVIRLGVSRDYDEITYRKMLNLLYDSIFYVGRAPKFVEADEEDLHRIFRARYEFDQKLMKRMKKPRAIPGTVCIQSSCCFCEYKDDNRVKRWLKKIRDSVPENMIVPIFAGISFFVFGFLYFIIWYLFKVVLTLIYVCLGVHISFLLGRNNDEEEEVIEEVERRIQELFW